MGKKRIALLSNITADYVAARLKSKYDVYMPAGYDTWIREAVSRDSNIGSGQFDAVVLLLDCTEARLWKDRAEAESHLQMWKQAILSVAEKIRTEPIFIPTLDIRENRIRALSERFYKTELENAWYQFAQDLSEQKGNVYVYDICNRIADIGRDRFYSDKMWYLGSLPYSKEGICLVADEIDGILRSAFEAGKKAITVDLDNTLWGGVAGEDGLEGIVLSSHKEGERFYDFQRQLLEMKRRGILLTINSKNNEDDVKEILEKHPCMLLKPEDFALEKINWRDKAENMMETVKELNLTDGSFIFIDDNPLERERVRSGCPEILVPDFPQDTTELLRFAETLFFTYIRPLRLSEEDLHKTEMYRAEERRKKDCKINGLDLHDYLMELEMEADIHQMRPDELRRVAQLCGKTNQFNLTTKRYTDAQLEELAGRDDSMIYTVSLKDRYGSYGLVSVVILKRKEKDILIDTFLMSCRVMGRGLEDTVINQIAVSNRDKAERLVGEFIPTAKNIPVKDLYKRLGFTYVESKGDSEFYELQLSKIGTVPKPVYKEIRFTG